ncbi:MAG: hypothetical protein MJE66_09690 [Proteobacteria bacterium]|nr:hypothetical protein [Pseudomonadota bacterium]
MATQAAEALVSKLVARVVVGDHRMAATDDPVFLGFTGPGGREFRLARPHGRFFRRGTEDVFVLAAPDDPETNVAHPALNDPTAPPLSLADLQGAYLRKGFEPIPNVRGLGEMDDRLLVERVELEVHTAAQPKPVTWRRSGPIWLGLLCGLRLELAPADAAP